MKKKDDFEDMMNQIDAGTVVPKTAGEASGMLAKTPPKAPTMSKFMRLKMLLQQMRQGGR